MKRIKLTAVLIAIALAMVSTNGSSQEAVASSESFDYYRCETFIQQPQIEFFYGLIESLVKTYNRQSNVDVTMDQPSISQCFISQGKRGSIVAGIASINFYIDSDHFRCSVNGNCTGDRAGYQASGTMMSDDKIQLTINTNKFGDAIQRCMARDGSSSVGRCN